jgi:hypothetical protein
MPYQFRRRTRVNTKPTTLSAVRKSRKESTVIRDPQNYEHEAEATLSNGPGRTTVREA